MLIKASQKLSILLEVSFGITSILIAILFVNISPGTQVDLLIKIPIIAICIFLNYVLHLFLAMITGFFNNIEAISAHFEEQTRRMNKEIYDNKNTKE